MKKHLLLFLLIISFLRNQAQSVNKARHSGIDATYSMISINSKSYYVDGITSVCCSDELNLVAINDSGSVMYKKNLAVTGADFFTRILKTRENDILVLGSFLQSCDVSGVKDFIARLDTNGNIVFNVNIQSSYVNPPIGLHEIIDVTQHPDSSFYLASSTDLLHYTSGGQFISRVTTGFTAINSILALSNGHLLINGMVNSQLKNIEVSTALTVINQQSTNNPIVKFSQSPSGTLFAKTQLKTIEKYSPTLTLVANSTIVIDPNSYPIGDFTLRNDSVFIAGVASVSATPYYALLDANLSLLYQTQCSYKNVRPTGISITDKNKVNIITNGSSNTSTNVTFSGLYQFGRNGSFNSISDIGVESYVATSTYLQPYYTGPYVSYFPLASFDVTVRNFGADTVKQFYLNQFQSGMGCNSLFHKLYQTTLAPGGTVTVQTGTFNTHYNPIILQSRQTYTTSLKICFFTTVPNFSNDVVISNDTNCDSVLFLVTGLDENSVLNAATNIFPNPIENNFKISCDIPMQAIKIYNVLGVLLKEEPVNLKDWEVKASDFPPGVYLVRIETEKGTVIKKVLKN